MQFTLCICTLIALCSYSCTAFCVHALVLAPASCTQQRASNTALFAKKKNKGPAKARVRGIPVEINVTMVPTSSLPSYAVAGASAAPATPQATAKQDATSSTAATSSNSSVSVTSAPPDMSVPTIVPRLVILDLDATMW
jgi:hypothetical protein